MQALWMIAASLMFSILGVCIKYASDYFHTAELVAYRGVLSILLLYPLVRWKGGSLKTSFPMMHLWRSLIGVASLAAWFYSIEGVALSTAMTLNYMSSVWVATFLVGGSLLMMSRGETAHRINGWLLATVIVGFAGVALILKPTIEQNQLWYGVIGLLGGIGAALAYIQIAALGKVGEPDYRVVYYFSLCCAVSGAVTATAIGWSAWHWAGVKWLLPLGILAVGGQLLLTRAYTVGSTLVAASLQYTGIVFSALFGVWLFSESLDAQAWIGMTMIVISGIGATILREKTSPNLHQEDRP
jgi:S-adenosylmethionine uptake transporter